MKNAIISSSGRTRVVSACAGVAAMLATSGAFAASATWNTTATNGNWITTFGETNWSTGDGTFPGSLSGVSTDVATFSNNSNVTNIAVDSTAGTVGPLYIGAIGFSGNTLTTNYTIGSTSGNALVVASNTAATASTNQIFISGALRAAPTASITETVNAPIIISAQTGGTTGFYTFQNNSLGLNSGDALVMNGTVSGASGNTATTLSLRGNNLNSNNVVNGAITDGASAGAMSLAKFDAGTWLVNGANTYTGTTSVTTGALVFGRAASLYNDDTSKWTSANITVGNGATIGVRVGGTGEFTNADVGTLLTNLGSGATNAGLVSGASFGFDTTNAAGGVYTYSNPLTNAANGANIGIRKLGTGTLALTGNNTNSGPITVSAGTLRIDGAGTLGTGAIVTNANFQYNSSAPSTIGSVTGNGLSGSGSLSVTGTGVLTIITNTFTSFAGGTTVGPGATLSVAGLGRTIQTVSSTTTNGSNTVSVASATNVIVGSVVTGTGIPAGTTVTAVNGTTFTLSNAATADGTNNLNFTPVSSSVGGAVAALTTTSGTNTATVADATGLAVGQTVVSPNFTGAITAINGTTITLSGNATLTGTVSSTIGQNNAGGLGNFVVDGGTVLYAGTGQNTGRSIAVGNNATFDSSGTGGFTFNGQPVTFVTPNLARTFTLTGTYGAGGAGGIANVINGPIVDNGTGALTLVKNGTGTWRLNGVSTYSGGTVLNAGGLEYNGLTNTVLGTGPLTINGGFIAARGNNATLTNNVLVGGDFQVGYDNAAVARNTTLTGTVDLGGATRTITVTNFNGDAPFDFSLSGTVSNGGITKTGTGTLQLAGANTYAGATNVAAGALLLNNQSAVQNSTVTLNGGSLAFAGTAYTLGGLAAASSGGGNDIALTSTAAGTPAVALTVGGNGTNTSYAGVLSGAGSLTKIGTGTLTLNGANTYSGATTVTGGRLQASVASGAANNLLTNAGGVDLGNGAGTLALNYAGASSPAANIKSILDAEYAAATSAMIQPFATGQLRSSAITAGRVIGYADDGSNVLLRVTLGGDANLDGAVNFNDFLALQANFGASAARFDQGNFNYDNVTDFNDFLILQANFGGSLSGDTVSVTFEEQAVMAAFAATVPEPSTAMVLSVAAGALIARRRRQSV